MITPPPGSPVPSQGSQIPNSPDPKSSPKQSIPSKIIPTPNVEKTASPPLTSRRIIETKEEPKPEPPPPPSPTRQLVIPPSIKTISEEGVTHDDFKEVEDIDFPETKAASSSSSSSLSSARNQKKLGVEPQITTPMATRLGDMLQSVKKSVGNMVAKNSLPTMIAKLTADQIRELSPEIISGWSMDQLQAISKEAFLGFDEEKLLQIHQKSPRAIEVLIDLGVTFALDEGKSTRYPFTYLPALVFMNYISSNFEQANEYIEPKATFESSIYGLEVGKQGYREKAPRNYRSAETDLGRNDMMFSSKTENRIFKQERMVQEDVFENPAAHATSVSRYWTDGLRDAKEYLREHLKDEYIEVYTKTQEIESLKGKPGNDSKIEELEKRVKFLKEEVLSGKILLENLYPLLNQVVFVGPTMIVNQAGLGLWNSIEQRGRLGNISTLRSGQKKQATPEEVIIQGIATIKPGQPITLRMACEFATSAAWSLNDIDKQKTVMRDLFRVTGVVEYTVNDVLTLAKEHYDDVNVPAGAITGTVNFLNPHMVK